jgi:hypothetical protein
MTSNTQLRVDTSAAMTTIEPSGRTLRLKLKPKAPPTGSVDGAWWPRTRDLSAELPALLAVLANRLGPVERVSYNLTAWDAAPRRLDIGDRQVRMGGFHAQDPHTVDVIGPSGSRLTLLVLPSATDPVAAHQTLITASRRDNVDGIDHLLTAAATTNSDGSSASTRRAGPAVRRTGADKMRSAEGETR